MFYTYLWLREDGTPYYVGKGSGRRAYQNKDHCVYRPKYNSLITVQYWESEEKAFEMEKWWIAFWGRKDIGTGILRNMTNGGDGPSGWVPSEETKAKIKEARKSQVFTVETRAKMGKSRRGAKHSAETKEKIGASQKGIPKPNSKGMPAEYMAEIRKLRWSWPTPEGLTREQFLQATIGRRRERNRAYMRTRRNKMSQNSGPNTRDGKPINTGDQATIAAFVTVVPTNVGPTTLITVQLQGSGLTVQVQAQDISATTQTL